jgi:hypothetical protein
MRKRLQISSCTRLPPITACTAAPLAHIGCPALAGINSMRPSQDHVRFFPPKPGHMQRNIASARPLHTAAVPKD